jgi:hypothetical protein
LISFGTCTVAGNIPRNYNFKEVYEAFKGIRTEASVRNRIGILQMGARKKQENNSSSSSGESSSSSLHTRKRKSSSSSSSIPAPASSSSLSSSQSSSLPSASVEEADDEDDDDDTESSSSEEEIEETDRQRRKRKTKEYITDFTKKNFLMKQPASAYILYMSAIRPLIIAQNPEMKFTDIFKIIGPMWKALSEEDSQPYRDQYQQKRSIYEAAKKKFVEESLQKFKDGPLVEMMTHTMQVHSSSSEDDSEEENDDENDDESDLENNSVTDESAYGYISSRNRKKRMKFSNSSKTNGGSSNTTAATVAKYVPPIFCTKQPDDTVWYGWPYLSHLPIILPKNDPCIMHTRDLHFRIPQHIVDQARTGPPYYKKIRRSIWVRDVKNVPQDITTECTCTTTCHSGRGNHNHEEHEQQCENAMTYIECSETNKLKSTSETNCCVGKTCGNRRLQQHKWKNGDIKEFNTNSHGWGVKANVDMSVDQLVMEYVGEIVDEEESEKRMIQAEKSGSRHVYMMQLDHGCVVDASKCGNSSRFINHSCDPNCELQRWHVGNEIRIGIFTIKNVAKDEELTYDYQLSAVQSFICRCGTAKCRGTLKRVSMAEMILQEEQDMKVKEEQMLDGIRANFRKNQKLSQKEKVILRNVIKERRKKNSTKMSKNNIESSKRLSFTGKYLPTNDRNQLTSRKVSLCVESSALMLCRCVVAVGVVVALCCCAVHIV